MWYIPSLPHIYSSVFTFLRHINYLQGANSSKSIFFSNDWITINGIQQAYEVSTINMYFVKYNCHISPLNPPYLPITAFSPPQWPLSSVPKVAVVKRFDWTISEARTGAQKLLLRYPRNIDRKITIWRRASNETTFMVIIQFDGQNLTMPGAIVGIGDGKCSSTQLHRSFSLSRNKKLNWKSSSGRSQENYML